MENKKSGIVEILLDITHLVNEKGYGMEELLAALDVTKHALIKGYLEELMEHKKG
jgi:hypothetical protein